VTETPAAPPARGRKTAKREPDLHPAARFWEWTQAPNMRLLTPIVLILAAIVGAGLGWYFLGAGGGRGLDAAPGLRVLIGLGGALVVAGASFYATRPRFEAEAPGHAGAKDRP